MAADEREIHDEFPTLDMVLGGELDTSEGRDGTLSRDDGHSFGRRVDVNAGTLPIAGPCTGDVGKERLWTVLFQQTGEANFHQVTMQLMIGIGAVKFTRKVLMPVTVVGANANNGASPMVAFHVWGRYVDISLTTANGQRSICNVAICPGGFAGPQLYQGTYVFFNSDSWEGSLFTGPGILGNARAIGQVLAGAAGVPFYPMLFDATALPINGTLPIMTLPAIRQLGDDVSFEDEWPGPIQFQAGLWIALSSTPDVLTQAGAGEIVAWAKVLL